MSVNTNIIKIPSKVDGNFFLYWFKFLKLFHSMSDTECEVAATLFLS